MNTVFLLLCVVVTLLYSTNLVIGNYPNDESSTLPSSTSVLDDRKTTTLPSSSVKDYTLSPSSSPTQKDITRSSLPSPSPSPLTCSPLNEGSHILYLQLTCSFINYVSHLLQSVFYLVIVRIGMIWG